MEFEDLVKIINDQIFVVAEKIEDEDGNVNVDLLLAGIAFSNSVDHFCDVIKSMAEKFIEEDKKRN